MMRLAVNTLMATRTMEPDVMSRASADGQGEGAGVGAGAEGVHGQDDEQGGEHEIQVLDAAEEGRADETTYQRSGRPGDVQAPLGPQDAPAGQRCVGHMQRVVIGMDPHKRSAAIEVMTGEETVACGGRFGTDRGGVR
jgi:hypothetical protein